MSARLVARSGRTWIEVRVSGKDAAALRACEVFAERERSLRSGTPDPVQTARACAPEVLAPIELDPGSHVLVDERPLEAGALSPLGEVQATFTTLHAFADAERCDELRERLRDANACARAEAGEHVRAWLEEQRARDDERAAHLCGEADVVAQRCAALRAGTVERSVCDVGRERAERECASARAMARAVTERIAEREAAPAEGAEPEPRCVRVDG